MPQLTLEFSSNIIEKNDIAGLLRKCHVTLAEMLPADIEQCKSRAIEQNNFLVGNGDKANAFVHCAVYVMPGRTTQKLEEVAKQVMQLLRIHFAKSLEELKLQITLAMHELPNIYLKITS